MVYRHLPLLTLVALGSGIGAGVFFHRSERLAVRIWLLMMTVNTAAWVISDNSRAAQQWGAGTRIVDVANVVLLSILARFGNIVLCGAAGYGVGILAERAYATRRRPRNDAA